MASLFEIGNLETTNLLYNEIGTIWKHEYTFNPSDNEDEIYSGTSVAIQHDSSNNKVYAVMSSPYWTYTDSNTGVNKTNAGKVYIKHLDITSGVWDSQTISLISSNIGTNNYFGYDISLSSKYLFVG